MVFKNKLFFSSKKSESSSPDASSSPRSAGSNSPVRSQKRNTKFSSKKKSTSNSQAAGTFSSSANGGADVRDRDDAKPGTSSSESKKDDAGKGPALSPVSPILASSLGLNRIKTKSGPLPQDSFHGFRGENVLGPLGSSNFSNDSSGDLTSSSNLQSGKMRFKESRGDGASNWDIMSLGSEQLKGATPNLQERMTLQIRNSSTEGHHEPLWDHAGGCPSSDAFTPEDCCCRNPSESESPRFQAILRATSAPKKRFPTDIKSFSHELNSKGVRPFPFWKPRGLNNLEEVLVVIRAKFDRAKEEVNSDLAVFAADLVGILEKNIESHPEWQETIEDLLVLARSCVMTSPGEFWLQCEGIVQEMDDRRQELPSGMLKQLHTRMLFILTRCTRLLQFHKESSLAEGGNLRKLRQSFLLHPSRKKGIFSGTNQDENSSAVVKVLKAASAGKSFSQEQQVGCWRRDHPALLAGAPAGADDGTPKIPDSPAGRDRMASWKKLPPPAGKITKEAAELNHSTMESFGPPSRMHVESSGDPVLCDDHGGHGAGDDLRDHYVKHGHKVSWGYWGDQQGSSEENSIICRICEEEIPTSHVEDHSGICAVADRCDQKGLSVNERLLRISEMLEKMMESAAQDLGSHDAVKASNFHTAVGDCDAMSPKLSDGSRRGSYDMLDCFPEPDSCVAPQDDLRGLFPSVPCRTRSKVDQAMTASSAGSTTPRSPLMTPKASPMDVYQAGKGLYVELGDLPQMNELADIARCVANTTLDDDNTMPYLITCLEDLRAIVERRKFDALTVETFGARIEKLIREKYLQLCELVEDEKVDITGAVVDEELALEDHDVLQGLRANPLHSKDRTSIDDFEIIKPISRGAFGRVFLAKKRTTGDLFAMKVLRKADMIRKNAVESILAERDILITVRNPFVVRFFYSFTCRENLYLVMEYLNGGDLYSLLRNLGCIEEAVARVYIAEVVLALEYLHSLQVVHRDLKPDNLLIAHDGHIKLTDFGLSKVGLINSTDDLSGPAASCSSMLVDEEPQLSSSDHHRERRKNRSAVGTPDYLAPEILLGTGHGTTADWWSVGIILFELIVGIPPFNAEHPQTIFANILNRRIPWPCVPEEMSLEAWDLIDRLLTEDPHQRLGSKGALEVKQHVFFKDINWDTLARQKAAFVPCSENALDTTYFTSRYSWNPSDQNVYHKKESNGSSDSDSLSGSSSCLSNHQEEEVGDKCGGLADFDPGLSVHYSFSNFSFKNLSQLASINYDLLSKGLKDDPAVNHNV